MKQINEYLKIIDQAIRINDYSTALKYELLVTEERKNLDPINN